MLADKPLMERRPAAKSAVATSKRLLLAAKLWRRSPARCFGEKTRAGIMNLAGAVAAAESIRSDSQTKCHDELGVGAKVKTANYARL